MFAVAGLLLLTIGVGQCRFQLRALKTIGIVVQHIEERRWDEGYYTIPYAVMHYEVHGRTYELRTSRTSRAMTDYPLGLVVDIAYDPGNPGDAQLWMHGMRLSAVLVLAGLLFLVVAVDVFHSPPAPQSNWGP